MWQFWLHRIYHLMLIHLPKKLLFRLRLHLVDSYSCWLIGPELPLESPPSECPPVLLSKALKIKITFDSAWECRERIDFVSTQCPRVKVLSLEEYQDQKNKSSWILKRAFVLDLNYLPPRLTHLTLPHCFSSPIDHLPVTLTHLTLGILYDNPVDHLPSGLTHLIVNSQNFKQPLDHLPGDLTHLWLKNYDHPLDHLPASLNYLFVRTHGYRYLPPLDHLPPNLVELEIRFPWVHMDHLPPSLRNLKIEFDSDCCFDSPCLDHLPVHLQHLELSLRGCRRDLRLTLENLPSHLKSLTFRAKKGKLKARLRHLPPHLEVLSLEQAPYSRFNFESGELPIQLKVLRTNPASAPFHENGLNHLPCQLTHLDLHPISWSQFSGHRDDSDYGLRFDADIFRRHLDWLPSQLTFLRLSSHFNQPLDHLPDTLKILCTGYAFNQPIDHLPSGLQYLELLEKFDQPLFHLPPALLDLAFMHTSHSGWVSTSFHSLPSVLDLRSESGWSFCQVIAPWDPQRKKLWVHFKGNSDILRKLNLSS